MFANRDASKNGLSDLARYSFVIPVHNEEAVVPLLLHRMERLLETLDGRAEVIFVDDGSTDTSGIVLAAKASRDPRFRLIKLSRNFGHQIAITAGMDSAKGDAVIVMDADLQDPPEVVGALIERWKEGFEVVYAQRISRAGESRFKQWTASIFYKLLSRIAAVDIPPNVGDFRLIDRKALNVFLQMRERDRFVRGMFGWMGFRQTAVSFHRDSRAAGETKYPLRKMLRLALAGLVGFSDAPLRIALWLGMLVSAFGLFYGAYAVSLSVFGGHPVAGWTSIIVVVSLLCGANLMMTGIVGIYVGRIHSEVKNRPLYLVDDTVGFERDAEEPSVRISRR